MHTLNFLFFHCSVSTASCKLQSMLYCYYCDDAGHASLTGAQHFMTFDRRFFEFAGDCSYLLMRDFISGTFSVIVNYDRAVRGRPVKKSLTVITGGRQLEVFPDGKVTVDGSRIEMPVRISNTTVTRTGHMIRIADEWRGVGVTCDLPHDHCSIAVSGYVNNHFVMGGLCYVLHYDHLSICHIDM